MQFAVEVGEQLQITLEHEFPDVAYSDDHKTFIHYGGNFVFYQSKSSIGK